jgi:hypothetical protein
MQEAGSREKRHPSPPRMLDRMLGEKQAHQQAAEKGGVRKRRKRRNTWR